MHRNVTEIFDRELAAQVSAGSREKHGNDPADSICKPMEHSNVSLMQLMEPLGHSGRSLAGHGDNAPGAAVEERRERRLGKVDLSNQDEADQSTGVWLTNVPGTIWRTMRASESRQLSADELRQRLVQGLSFFTGVQVKSLSVPQGLSLFEPMLPEDMGAWRENAVIEARLFSDWPISHKKVVQGIGRQAQHSNLVQAAQLLETRDGDLESGNPDVIQSDASDEEVGRTAAARAARTEYVRDAEGERRILILQLDLLLGCGRATGAHLACRLQGLVDGDEDAHLHAMERVQELAQAIERVLGGGNDQDQGAAFIDFAGALPSLEDMSNMVSAGRQGHDEESHVLFAGLQRELTHAQQELRLNRRALQEREDEIEILRDELRQIRQQRRAAQAAISQIAGSVRADGSLSESGQAVEEPDLDEGSVSSKEGRDGRSLDWLPQWAEDNTERIVIMPRALAGAKKSRYKDAEHIREALEFLAGPYRDLRQGRIEQAQMEKALREAGLGLRGSAASQIAGEEGAAYFVRWDGRRRFMDMHLTRGGGHDQRYCMRIYWFWDEAGERAIVGHLPSHLPNSLS